MKTRILSGLIGFAVGLCSSFLGGCSSIGRTVDRLPRGTFAELTYIRASNVGSTEILLTGVDSTDAYFRADTIDANFANPWVGKVTLRGKGYHRVRRPGKDGAEGPIPAP